MARLAVIEYPNPQLRLHSLSVTDFDDTNAQLVDDLIDTLNATPGIGLSAPQVDVQRQVLVMDLSEDKRSPEVFINPEIIASAKPGFVEESCLSVPGVKVNVMRATELRVRAQDRDGDTFERNLQGMHAVCLQHEMEHLEGKLLVDKLFLVRRWWVKGALKKRANLDALSRGQDAA